MMSKQREFFNSMADRWDIICQHDPNKIKFILDLLIIENNAKILDVGTGTGILIPFLLEQIGEDGKIIAIDVSNKMLEIAQRKYTFRNVFFLCEDIFKTSLSENYFDIVICYSVFPHFEDKKFAIKSIGKHLKKGGKFIIFHSQSREEINNMHKCVSDMVSDDDLPSMDVIKEYFGNLSFKPIIEIDNNEMFVIIAEKEY